MRNKPERPHYIGIDFGTSKCVTTWYNPDKEDASVINDHETGEWQVPSVVYYTPRGEAVVGQTALHLLTDAEASGPECDRVVLSAKRHIARRMRYMFDPYPTPRQVAAEIFRKLRRGLIEGHFHFEVTRAVVTVPASYDLIQREGIRRAALDAGFEEVVLVDEPTAAAIAYAREAYLAQTSPESVGSLPRLGESFLVYDLGAGTFDLAVLRRTPRGQERGRSLRYEVALRPGGFAFGGDDIDKALYHYLDKIAEERYGRPISHTNQMDSRFLMQCRKAKVGLTHLPAVTISAILRNTPGLLAAGERPELVTFEHLLERETFEELIEPLIASTLEPVRQLLERARQEGLGRDGEDFPLDNIILIGGSSKIPLIRQVLQREFKIGIVSWSNQDQAVALGAAYVAYDVFGPRSSTAYSIPPVVAARIRMEIPPVPLAPGGASRNTLTLSHGLTPIRETTLDQGLHVVFNIPPGHATLYAQVAGNPPQSVDLDAAANTFYKVRLEYDAAAGRFNARTETLGRLSAEPTALQVSGEPAWRSDSSQAKSLTNEETELLPDNLSETLRHALQDSARSLREAGADTEMIQEFEQMATTVHEPCVVAVVGRVKAGKSTFVNALLGEDLARVGATETTATINRFAFGAPNPERPVRCVSRTPEGQRISEETREFLDSLQGNDPETLARAREIEYLEYRLERPFLRRVTLVDTPGMGAAVEEHNQRVQAFLGLEQREMAERAYERSRRVGSGADAVIFVIGPVARMSDRDFLNAFEEVLYPEVGALNAVGVMAKVDERPEIFARRHELCARIQEQLASKLNVVVPVSAALERYLDAVDSSWFAYLVYQIRSIPRDEEISPSCTLGFLLGMDRRWKTEDDPDCPVPPSVRARLAEGLPWSTFVTMARTIALHPTERVSEIEAALRNIAGFEPLREILEQRFVQRGDLLRAYRVVQRALELLDQMKRHGLPRLEAARRAEQERFARFREFLRRATTTPALSEDDGTRQEMSAFLLDAERRAEERPNPHISLEKTEYRLTGLLHALQDDHSDLDALQSLTAELMENGEAFTEAEQKELRPLFGLYGRSLETRLGGTEQTEEAVAKRMAYWANIGRQGLGSRRRQSVAHAATQRYGILLDALLRRQQP